MSFPALRKTDVFLAPGEMYCSYAPSRVWTILGSCVSVVIWHPRLLFGAMSHYLLPENLQRGAGTRTKLDPRYGVDSCTLILRAMRRLGISPDQCEARLFGGSQMGATTSSGSGEIGRRNAAVARDFLKHNRIPLESESLFGAGHRRISFDIDTGRVWEKVGGGLSTTRTHRKLRVVK